jgi:hypothetical protein
MQESDGTTSLPRCAGAMCCERTPFACQPPLQRRIRSVRARQQRKGLLLLLRITSRPMPSVDAYEAPAAGTVPYPSTDHHAVGLSAAASCVVGSACGGPASHHARFAWWSGGGRGKRARKGTCTSKCTSSYPYPASLARLKHLNLKHSSQSLPRIT